MFHLYTQRFCFVLERKEIIHLWLHRQHCNGDSNDEFKREVRPGGMWMTAVVRSSSHRRTSPTGRSRRSLMFRRTGSCQPISTPPRKPDTYTYALQETGHTHHTPTRHTHIHAGCRAQEVWQPQSATCPNAARCDDGGPPRPPRLFREPSHPQRTRAGHDRSYSESGRGARTLTNAHPPPTPYHPSFPDTPHQGRRECSPCSVGAPELDQKPYNHPRCAAGMHARIESGS